MGVNSLPKTVTRQRRGCDLNPDPTAPESSTIATRLPSHANCTLLIMLSVLSSQKIILLRLTESLPPLQLLSIEVTAITVELVITQFGWLLYKPHCSAQTTQLTLMANIELPWFMAFTASAWYRLMLGPMRRKEKSGCRICLISEWHPPAGKAAGLLRTKRALQYYYTVPTCS